MKQATGVVDKYAGENTRIQIEKGVMTAAQSAYSIHPCSRIPLSPYMSISFPALTSFSGLKTTRQIYEMILIQRIDARCERTRDCILHIYDECSRISICAIENCERQQNERVRDVVDKLESKTHATNGNKDA